jgi:hypothetical protein
VIDHLDEAIVEVAVGVTEVDVRLLEQRIEAPIDAGELRGIRILGPLLPRAARPGLHESRHERL